MATIEWDPRLDERGAQLHEATVAPGTVYWRVVSARWRDRNESQGLHHILVDVIGEDLRRIVGVPVKFAWASGYGINRTEPKPGEDKALAFPMFVVAPAYSVQVDDGRPSDRVSGMGLGSIVAPEHAIHSSYHIVFRLTTEAATSPPPRPPAPPSEERQAVLRELELARAHLDSAYALVKETGG